MISLIMALHIVVCVSLVIVVLLQQGKGAEVGAVFGGSSQTVFGASGAGNVLTRATAGLAVLFFATSMYLAYMSTQRATGSIFGGGSSSVMPKQTAPKSIPPSNSQSNSQNNSMVPAPAPNAAMPQAPAPPANK